MMINTLDIGLAAENRACAFLEKQGMHLLYKNYDCKFGEIDLIMKDGDYVVFTEVRCRNNQDYTSALESVSPAKKSKIIKTAMHYLLEKNWYNKVDCRFDVIAFEETEMNWIKNAFEVDPAL